MNDSIFLRETFDIFLKRYDNIKNANSREKVKSKLRKIEEYITIDYRNHNGDIRTFIAIYGIEQILKLMMSLYNSSTKPITKKIAMKNYMSYTLQYLGFLRRNHKIKNIVESDKTKSEKLSQLFEEWMNKMGLVNEKAKKIVTNEELFLLEQECRDKIEDFLETNLVDKSDFKKLQSCVATLISIKLIAKNETLQTLDIDTVEAEIENKILTLNKVPRKLDSFLVRSIEEFIKYRNIKALEGVTTLFINDKGDKIGDNNEYLFSIVKEVLDHQSMISINKRCICNLMQEEKCITHTEIEELTGYKKTVIGACDKKAYEEKKEKIF